MGLFNLAALALPVQAGAPPPSVPDARGSLAVFCPTQCEALALPTFAVQTRLPAVAERPVVVVTDVSEGWQRPSAEDLSQWGEGQVAGMDQAAQVVLLEWAAPRDQAPAALAALLQAASAAGPWLEVVDTGRDMDAATAGTLAVAASAPDPDLSALSTIAVLQEGDGSTRLLGTRGLRNLGLPELDQAGVPAAEVDRAAARLNAVAQAMYEVGVVSVLEVDSSRFHSASARSAACGLKGTASLSYDHGHDKLLGPGPRVALARFDGAFGSCTDAVAAAPAAPVVVAPAVAAPAAPDLASVRVHEIRTLTGPVHDAWLQGLPAGDHLLVKAPFPTAEGRVEWLWVEVSDWGSPETLTGRLVSSPTLADGVARGDTVKVPVAVVYDYLWRHADGSSEGNETQAWLE